MYILSIDFGTSSLKLSVLNEKLEMAKELKEEYQYNVINNDNIEIDTEIFFSALIKGMKRIEEDYLKNIEIVAYDTLSPSLVALDKNGDSIHPCILHLDRRSYKQSQEIVDKMGAKGFQNITGVLPFSGGVSITSLLWIKENVPGVYNNTYKFGHLNTYIYKKLTGKWAIDPVNASMTGLYETTKWGNWSPDILNTFGISHEKLPDIIDIGTLGTLQKDVAVSMGLREGIPVMLGTNDAASALIGVGVENEGDIMNMFGSNEVGITLTDKPIVNDEYYLRNSPYKGKWQLFSINIGGTAIEWLRKIAFFDMDINYFYNEYMTDLANRFDPDRYSKSTERCKPYFAGDRHDLVQKRGIFTGLSLSTNRDDMMTALLVGMFEPLLNNIAHAGKIVKLNRNIIITEGLARTPIVNFKKKLLPDFTFEFKDRGSTAGNGILALKALGK